MADGGEGALWARPATEVVGLLRRREVSPDELMDALEARVGAVDPVVNALPTLCFDRARRAAKARGGMLPAEDVLCGLPVPIKDSIPVAGVRTTFGSRAFADHVPERSDAVVEALECRGALVFAKSNTPEFEAGANTFNEVFGATRNPWNIAWSAGGSSGGAAVAVATGMAWAAQGTDFACSLRNPASFSGVVGLRPSPGVVPMGPNLVPFQTLSVAGPIARTVGDCGLFLDAMATGRVERPCMARPPGRDTYAAAAARPACPERVACSADLGITPVDPAVRAVFARSMGALSRNGISPVEVAPDVGEAHQSFRALRALQFATAWGHLLPAHRDRLKPDVVWNIEEGQKLSGEAIIRADRARAEIRARVLAVLDEHDFLILPTSIVAPYAIDERYVASCDGTAFADYLQWMAIAYVISLTGCPAISVPAGFTDAGQPVGLQIVGKPYAEADLLSFAAAAEGIWGAALSRPITPAG